MITEQGHLRMTNETRALIFNQSLDVLNFTLLVFSPDCHEHLHCSLTMIIRDLKHTINEVMVEVFAFFKLEEKV